MNPTGAVDKMALSWKIFPCHCDKMLPLQNDALAAASV
jgi:hypothetical protein